MDTPSFAERIDAAYSACVEKNKPFMLSPADMEQAVQPIVDDLLKMSKDAAMCYIVKTHRGAGTVDAIALKMYRKQLELTDSGMNSGDLIAAMFRDGAGS